MSTSSGLRLDPVTTSARWRGRAVPLTPRELSLLALLVAHPGRLITAEELSVHAWGEPLVSRETVASAVKRVRSRLRSVECDPDALVTVRALGYRWDGEPGTASHGLGQAG